MRREMSRAVFIVGALVFSGISGGLAVVLTAVVLRLAGAADGPLAVAWLVSGSTAGAMLGGWFSQPFVERLATLGMRKADPEDPL